MMPALDDRMKALLFPSGLRPGDVVEFPFRTGVLWRVRDDLILERCKIPRRVRPRNTHRYTKGKRARGARP